MSGRIQAVTLGNWQDIKPLVPEVGRVMYEAFGPDYWENSRYTPSEDAEFFLGERGYRLMFAPSDKPENFDGISIYHPQLSDSEAANVAWLAVVPEMQRNGMGTSLYSQSKDKLRGENPGVAGIVFDMEDGRGSISIVRKQGGFPVRDCYLPEGFPGGLAAGPASTSTKWWWDPLNPEFSKPDSAYLDRAVASCLRAYYTRDDRRENAEILRLNFQEGFPFSTRLLR